MTDPLVNIRKGTLLAGNLPFNMADYRSSMLPGVIRLCLQTDQNASLISSLPTVISHHQLFGSQVKHCSVLSVVEDLLRE